MMLMADFTIDMVMVVVIVIYFTIYQNFAKKFIVWKYYWFDIFIL